MRAGVSLRAMPRFLRSSLAALTLATALGAPALVSPAAHAAPSDTETPTRRIAIVVGLSSYEKLPPELQLETPRTEAARVAAALE